MPHGRAQVLLVALFVVGLAIGTEANHQWDCYKYADTTILFYNGGSGGYYNIFEAEAKSDSDSWEQWSGSVMYLPQTYSYGTSDQINTANGYYGETGWLGLATIHPSGCTVGYGDSVLNQSYLDSGYTDGAKHHVACQEIGHQFGLAHQYTSDSCMNDSQLGPQQPNKHDRDMLRTIYGFPSATFYVDINYSGDSLGTKTPTISVPSLGYYGWNDLISAVRVVPWNTVVLYEHENYGGASLTLTSDAPDLRSYSGPGPDGTWNDVASSVIIY